MPSDGPWRAIGTVDPARLTEAATELHWALQVVAAAGQTFAEPRDDDSHRAATWDAELRAFVGAPLAGAYPFRVAIRPEDLTLILLDRTDSALGSLPLAETTHDAAHDWLALGLATYMGGPPARIERPDYDMPEHPVKDGAAFESGREAERRTLSALYGGAAEMLRQLVRSWDDASEITCWPHHFDIATLITLERDDDGQASKTVGVGLAPSGGGYEGWYWYVTPWPYPDAERLPDLAGPGEWRTEGWTGAVLTGETLVETDEAFREAVVRKFLDVSVEAAVASLRGEPGAG